MGLAQVGVVQQSVDGGGQDLDMISSSPEADLARGLTSAATFGDGIAVACGGLA
jgi:hypothetical protein